MNDLTICVTGAGGFVGQHVVRRLQQAAEVHVVQCPRSAWESTQQLAALIEPCDAVVHLAALNRGRDEQIYRENLGLLARLTSATALLRRPPRIVFASSTQRKRDNVYGRSKRDGELLLERWAAQGDGRAAISLEIPNVFGPGCRPFYNSVVATFCHQLAHGEPPQVATDAAIEFAWVGDVAAAVETAVRDLLAEQSGYYALRRVAGSAPLLVSKLLTKLQGFLHSEHELGVVPDLTDPLDARLYATLRSYMPLDSHLRRPQVHADARGDLCEVIRMATGGQVFFSTTRPGVIRGNHYHTRKSEWFCVLRGDATIRLRRVGSSKVEEIAVSGREPTFVSIPVLHTHHIENTGADDLLTMFWCNEHFDAADPDTFAESVISPAAGQSLPRRAA